MYQKFKDLFTKNLPWKAFSILVSALLWFIVMNINNPTEIKAFTIPLNLSDLSEFNKKNISILNMDELNEIKVEIKLKATRPVLDELRKKVSNSDIKAYLDTTAITNLSEITSPLEISSQIKTNLNTIPYPNNNFEILSFSPSSINVAIDTFVTVPKKVYVNKTGSAKNGYIASNPEISSEYVQISGAKSIVDSVDYVSVNVDISNKSTSFSENATPVAYDKNGDIVKNVSFNLENINVKVPINLQKSVEFNKPELIGNLPEGYSVKDISYSPSSVQAIGDSISLKNISSINLPSINISNLTSSTKVVFKAADILKEYNLELEKPETEIVVFVEIEKTVERTLTINSSELNISNASNLNISLPDTFNIKINGLEDNIKNLDLNKIKASIDLKDLKIGSHDVEIDVSLPENIYLSSTPYINITIENPSENSSENSSSVENNTEISSKNEEITNEEQPNSSEIDSQ